MLKQHRPSTKKKFAVIVSLFLLTLSVVGPGKVSAAYDGANLIDNQIFLNSSSMSISAIQNFLVSKGSGLSSRSFLLNCYGASSKERAWYTAAGAPCDQTVPASQIIYYAAQIYGISPQVILATLQKEQSLITSPNPTDWQINQAMGYGCPTTGGCGASNFFYQIDYGVWVLRYHYERAGGNYTWWNTNGYTCGTPKNFYTPGLIPGNAVTFYDEDGVPYRTHVIGSAATAALYCYTPHAYNNPQGLYGLPVYGTTGRYYTGSYNFVKFFESWFGGTLGASYYSCRDATNVVSASTGGKVVPNLYNAAGNATFTLTLPNNTGSACMEAHTWGNNQQNWITNVATNHPAINPADGEIISGNIYGDAKSELIFVKYRNTGSGRIEVHAWDSSYQRWVSNVATNHPAIDPADGRVIAADMNGDGTDELVFVKYRNNGSGMIEVHTWAAGQQAWLSNVATNVAAGDPADARVIAANLYGDSRDELVFVKYRNTGSGMIELHAWAAGQQAWLSNVSTNHPVVDPADIEIMSGNVYGGAVDEMVLVKYRNTGSGRIEVHTWAAGQQAWLSNIATSTPSL